MPGILLSAENRELLASRTRQISKPRSDGVEASTEAEASTRSELVPGRASTRSELVPGRVSTRRAGTRSKQCADLVE